MILKEHVPLAPFTTFGVGGRADIFIEIHTEEEVRAAFIYAREHKLPIAVLGGGSNILVPDEGIRGVVLCIKMDAVSFQKENEETVLCTAEAGAVWDDVVQDAVTKGVWGIENLSGIPGTVGGAVVQNIGAYGAVLSDTIRSVDVYDVEQDITRTWTGTECGFGYRTSIFKRSPGRYIVLRARITLSTTLRPNVTYRDLASHFELITSPTATAIRDAVLAIRRTKFPDRAQYGTAGSFFLNPVLPEPEARAIAARFPGMPLFPMPEGGVKVPIAWLLDYRHGVLDMRDMKVGGAFVWPAQPLVIATERDATARDVTLLARKVAARVHEATGIALTPELGTFGETATV